MAEIRVGEVLRFLKQRVHESRLAQARVLVFGSYARGRATPDSDMDVAIISPDFKGKDIFERARMTREIEFDAMREFQLPFDFVTLTPEEFEGESMIGDFIRQGRSH